MKLRPPVKVPTATCPHCGASQDGASGIQTHYPEPNNVSVCIRCASVSVFDENLQRSPWPATEPLPPEVIEAVSAVRRLYQ